MQESALEMAVVGNLLMVIDEGKVHQFKGKKLRDITLQGIVKVMMKSNLSQIIVNCMFVQSVDEKRTLNISTIPSRSECSA